MTSTTSTVERGRMPAARRDRRAALAALALLLVLLGALGSALLVFRSGDRESVLVAAQDIPFGHVITRADLTETRAAADDRSLLLSSVEGQVIGTRATTRIPEGALVNGRMFSTTTMVPTGGEAVGIVLDAAHRPSTPPAPGDVVRIYYVAGGSDNSATVRDSDNPVIVNAARVIDTGAGDSAGTLSLTVLVRGNDAPDVTQYAASGNLAVTKLPDDTKPAIDWQQ
jgi:hypothetical protein